MVGRANEIYLPPSGWLVFLEHEVYHHLRTVSAASKLNPQQWLGDPMHSSNLVITAISFMSPLNNHWAWKRRLSFIHKVVHFIQMILDIHSAKSVTIFHPKSSLSSVLQSCSFHVLDQLTGQIISLVRWIITKDLQWVSGEFPQVKYSVRKV